MKRSSKTISPQNALTRLEELCARSEQCSFDLRQKLVKWGVERRHHDEIIGALEKAMFVDDARFARAYVRDKYRFNRWGRMKIIRGLMAKRISRVDIDSSLDEIDVKEYALNCYRLLKAKLRTIPAECVRYDAKQKLLRFGVGRGFETALLVKFINSEKLWSSRNCSADD